jgi:hypothetical protein
MHTILTAPAFEDRQPPRDATIWRISLTAACAFKLICDIGHLYPTHEHRPRVGAMLEYDGALTLYVWPRVDPDSQLLLLMLSYSGTRLADASRWHGQTWLSGDLLARVLAVLAARTHFEMRRAIEVAR